MVEEGAFSKLLYRVYFLPNFPFSNTDDRVSVVLFPVSTAGGGT